MSKCFSVLVPLINGFAYRAVYLGENLIIRIVFQKNSPGRTLGVAQAIALAENFVDLGLFP